MNIFSGAYQKSRRTLQNPTFSDDFEAIINGLKQLMASDGPDTSKATVLASLREKFKDDKHWYQRINTFMAAEILNANLPEKVDFQVRCARLKFIRHFYVVSRKGNQSIWAADSPKKYQKWTYEWLKYSQKKQYSLLQAPSIKMG